MVLEDAGDFLRPLQFLWPSRGLLLSGLFPFSSSTGPWLTSTLRSTFPQGPDSRPGQREPLGFAAIMPDVRILCFKRF